MWQVFSDCSNDLAGLNVSVYGGLVPLGFTHSNFTSAITVYHKFLLFAMFLSRQLKKEKIYAIISLLLGETGEKPVRVRRRKVYEDPLSYPPVPQTGLGTGHWSNLRRLKGRAPSRNIPAVSPSDQGLRDRSGEGIYFNRRNVK